MNAFGLTIPYDERLHVFWAEIPKVAEERIPLACKERETEIAACKSGKVKAQKYYAWRLLEQVLTEKGVPLSACNFQKLSSGKWRANGVSFSLSHSENIVAVALIIAEKSVGVDVERVSEKAVKKLKNIHFLTVEEGLEYAGLPQDAQADYLVSTWTRKESMFKVKGQGVFRPDAISSKTPTVATEWLDIVGERFALSVACEQGIEGKIIIEKRSV